MVDFAPVRGSVFEDPGDEKSWHISQRSTSLTRYFEGREPSWYASAIAPLKGAERVLDLGCGPGLTLQAFLDQGASSVLGLDRWPAFTAGSTASAPIVAHDLTLPMPFLESGSFDAVFSHYALDYTSPVCTRQVLREAHRLLAPGGRLLILMAAIGLGGGDESRTISYLPPALRALLAEAGFEEIDVEAPHNGRNSVAKARRSAAAVGVPPREPEARVPISGDTQLSASFPSGSDRVECELSGAGRGAVLALDLSPARSPEEARVSVCARVQLSESGGTELQLWAWRGFSIAAVECARFEFAATEMRVDSGGDVEHVSAWSPGEPALEPPGDAYSRISDLPPGDDLSEAERGAEGRLIVVESPRDEGSGLIDLLGPGRNRFLIRSPAGADPAAFDRQWLGGEACGIVLAAEELAGDRMREWLLWAGWRQALVFLRAANWAAILAVASRREAELRSPVVLVDPALDGRAPEPLPSEIVAFAESHGSTFVLLGSESRYCSARGDLERLERRLLHGGPAMDGVGGAKANENLRHLTERTMLMRLRQASGCSWAEVGRRPAI